MTDDLKAAALAYHRQPAPGRISVTPTTLLSNQRDLTLAYSPGVAAASEAIVEDPSTAFSLSKVLAGGIAIGPVVMGLARPAHVVTSAITVRGLVNMTAVAVVDAQAHEAGVANTGGGS